MSPRTKKLKFKHVKLMSIKDNGLCFNSAKASSIPVPLRYTQPIDQMERLYPIKTVSKKHVHAVISSATLDYVFKSDTVRRSILPFQGVVKRIKNPGPAFYVGKPPKPTNAHHFNVDKVWV